MNSLPLKNINGDSIGKYEIADNLLINNKGEQAVHEAVVAYLAHQRAGTASTKSKSEVAGSGKKPWKQKGSGRARAGYKQSPIWRGGAVAHGPHPRKYKKKVPKKVAKLAFNRALSSKIENNEIAVIDAFNLDTPKTKSLNSILLNLGLDRGLIIFDKISENVQLAARNLVGIEVVNADLVNTYQILRHKQILVTKEAMNLLIARVDKKDVEV